MTTSPARARAVRPVAASLWFLPVATRVPLKFGPETLTEVVCARVRLTVEDRQGRRAHGWGETPLSVQWVWPSPLTHAERQQALMGLCVDLVHAWSEFDRFGHPLEVGRAFLDERLPDLTRAANLRAPGRDPLPHLAALVCNSPFDLALHDAFGNLHGIDLYQAYGADWLESDLAAFLEPAEDARGRISFQNLRPDAFLTPRRNCLTAWHLVGGLDKLEPHDLDGTEPDDGYPVHLRDWIARDGLTCLKIKLRGDDPAWDFDRLQRVGRIAAETGVQWLSADFNCVVRDPSYVVETLDRLLVERPDTFARLLYVEQPFPYDLEAHPLDVRSVSARKPLFLDESAHDWRVVRLGRSLGWTGVALKTCKTQTEAILALCWARAHGMTLMVQDLTNPMLAQIPHLLLAAHAGTIQGVETNAMQFYPDASAPEATVHPGLYRRREGMVRLDSIQGPGFGIRVEEIPRSLPEPAAARQ